MWRHIEGKGKAEQEKRKKKEPGSRSSISNCLKSLICILSVFVSMFPVVLTVLYFPTMNGLMLYANPAGVMCRCKLKMFFPFFLFFPPFSVASLLYSLTAHEHMTQKIIKPRWWISSSPRSIFFDKDIFPWTNDVWKTHLVFRGCAVFYGLFSLFLSCVSFFFSSSPFFKKKKKDLVK